MGFLLSKYKQSCRSCHTPIAVGDKIYWSVNELGVLCSACKVPEPTKPKHEKEPTWDCRPEGLAWFRGFRDKERARRWAQSWANTFQVTVQLVEGGKKKVSVFDGEEILPQKEQVKLF